MEFVLERFRNDVWEGVETINMELPKTSISTFPTTKVSYNHASKLAQHKIKDMFAKDYLHFMDGMLPTLMLRAITLQDLYEFLIVNKYPYTRYKAINHIVSYFICTPWTKLFRKCAMAAGKNSKSRTYRLVYIKD